MLICDSSPKKLMQPCSVHQLCATGKHQTWGFIIPHLFKLAFYAFFWDGSQPSNYIHYTDNLGYQEYWFTLSLLLLSSANTHITETHIKFTQLSITSSDTTLKPTEIQGASWAKLSMDRSNFLLICYLIQGNTFNNTTLSSPSIFHFHTYIFKAIFKKKKKEH